MNAPLRVALVGYGFVGKVFHAPLIQATPGLVLHTVVSRDAGKVHADWPDVQVVGDPDAAFADPAVDVVVIASPNDSHAPLAMAALAQGKHVVVDKPFTVTLTEARDVVDAARRAGRLVSVFQNRRWDGDFLTVQRLVGDGTLGRVAEFHSHFDRFRPVVQDRWREHDAPGGGLWYDLGPHLIDQAVQLFGLPEAISVDIARLRDGAQAPDYVHATLRYPTHRAHLHAGTLVAGNGLRFAVHGTRGSYLKHGLDVQEDRLACRRGAGRARLGRGHPRGRTGARTRGAARLGGRPRRGRRLPPLLRRLPRCRPAGKRAAGDATAGAGRHAADRTGGAKQRGTAQPSHGLTAFL